MSQSVISATDEIYRPRAILFDWDNTLVDSWGAIHAALNTALGAMNKPLWSLEETRHRARLSLRDSFPILFGERWQEARDVFLDAFRAIHLDRLTALPGRAEMLAELSQAGFYLGIVSNKTGALLRQEAEHIGWRSLFREIVGAGDAIADKPDPAPVLMALGQSGIAPGETVWFVGDTAIDMICARDSGCISVRLGIDAPEDEFAQITPRLAFVDARSLADFVRDLRFIPAGPSS